MPKLPRLSLTRIVFLVVILVVGYFAFATIGDTLLSHQVSQDEQALRQEVAQLAEDKAMLEGIREYLWTDEYVESVARRMLGLVREGESLVIVSSNAPATPPPEEEQVPDQESSRSWWERLYVP